MHRNFAKFALTLCEQILTLSKIIVFDSKNYQQYANFPPYITEKFEKGIISKTHFSDLLRLQLLVNHGGTWIDSTVYCTKSPDFAFNIPIFVFKNNDRADPSCVFSSWFISSQTNDSILTLTRDLLFEYWKNHDSLFHYFLIHFFFTMATEKFTDEWKAVPTFSNIPPHTLQRELFDEYSVILKNTTSF